MKYVLFYEPAPDFRARVPAVISEHRALWKRFREDGTLLLIGPCTDGTALGVFRTREAAESFAAEDPFVKSGVVSRWTIREWMEALTAD